MLSKNRSRMLILQCKDHICMRAKFDFLCNSQELSSFVCLNAINSLRIIFKGFDVDRPSLELLLCRVKRAQHLPQVQCYNLHLCWYLQVLLELPSVLSLDIVEFDRLWLLYQSIANLTGSQRIVHLLLVCIRLLPFVIPFAEAIRGKDFGRFYLLHLQSMVDVLVVERPN